MAHAERAVRSRIRENRSANRDGVYAGCPGKGIGAPQGDRPAHAPADGVFASTEYAQQFDIGVFSVKGASTRGRDITGDREGSRTLIADDRRRSVELPVTVGAVAVADIDDIIGILARLEIGRANV